MSLVKFVTDTSANFSSLTNKDDNTIYFISDEKKIYKGATPYGGEGSSTGDSSNVEAVDDKTAVEAIKNLGLMQSQISVPTVDDQVAIDAIHALVNLSGGGADL